MYSVPRRTPAYIAWLLPVGTLFFLCGILLGRSLLSWPALGLLMALGICAALLARDWRRTVGLGLAALALGGLLCFRADHPSLLQEGSYRLQGTVIQQVSLRADGQVQTVLTDVTLDGVPHADAYWTYYLDEEEALPSWLTPGVRLAADVRLYHPSPQMNPGGFDFREYLLQRGILYGVYGAEHLTCLGSSSSLRAHIAALRHHLASDLMDVMGTENGAYAAAMLLGTQDFIPEDDRAAFRDLGIAHILSVSGYHVGVLAAMMLLAMRPFPLGRRPRLVIEAAVLGAYSLLIGGNAPVIRAALLLLWREFTRLRHRQVLPLHMLCVTALIQLAFNPLQLFSASFQLTYSAMLGLLLVFPRLRRHRTCRTHPGQRLWEAFCAAAAAQLGVLFPQLYWFGRLPVLSILLNMIFIPLFTGLMTLYWLTLLLLPVPGLRELLGWLAGGATQLLLAGIRHLAAQDFTSLWTRQADLFTFAGWALVIFAGSLLLPRALQRHRRRLLVIGGVLMALLLFPLPERTTTYTQFSVGNADAALLQDRDATVVVDTGEDGQALASYLHQRRQRIEILIITHLHIDHAGGVRALLDEGIPVEVCYLPADASIPVIDEETLPLLDELARTGTEFRFLHRGDVLTLPSGTLTVLWPEKGRVFPQHDANDVNLVLQADIAGVTMLLTGDLTGAYEEYAALPSDILKIAHHGSKDATTPAFLEAVNPQALLLSNRDETRNLRMAELAGDVPLYATGSCGAVTILFLGDGRFTVQTVKTTQR